MTLLKLTFMRNHKMSKFPYLIEIILQNQSTGLIWLLNEFKLKPNMYLCLLNSQVLIPLKRQDHY